MSKKSENASLTKRYKHKLNMLYPGQIMLKISLILFGLGLIFCIFQVEKVYVIFFCGSGIVLLALFILVAIELHQDRVLYELAKSQDPEIK